MPTTKVTGLTPSNVAALRGVAGEIRDVTCGATYAVFEGDPEAVLMRLEIVMNRLLISLGGRSFEYRSLIAVRNKLRKFVENETNSGKHVRVTDR
ncbi:hypothetical protein [Rhodococcus sp. 11-3]|uniref:hypothetical protein n=1 Tax=Rhodococcus sp. 11-3 TaxID=2854796 RepID=UPI00203F5C99|nr:hypothetical protein [Rhodococcus sp. 11-3]USC17071.1 hypothetical protein KZJ41_09465 [Rhodococcus sp. 11-3]